MAFLTCPAQSLDVRSTGMGCFFFWKNFLPVSGTSRVRVDGFNPFSAHQPSQTTSQVTHIDGAYGTQPLWTSDRCLTEDSKCNFTINASSPGLLHS